jgi:methylmalonyl-CoA/ethylmalonyl-CoA epimerase
MDPSNNIVNFFGEDAEFEHAGIAVRSINDSVDGTEKTEDPIQRVNVAFMYLNNFKIELIEPITEKSPVTKILDKGQSLYHLCFRVPDINKAIETARKHGFHCIARPVPAKAFNDNKVAWVFSKVYGLFELIEAEG